MLVLRIRGFFVPLVDIRIYRLGIAKSVHQEYDFLLLDLILLVNRLFGILNGRAPLSGKFFFNLVQICYDDFCHRIIVVQDILISGDVLERLFMLFHQGFQFQADQFI